MNTFWITLYIGFWLAATGACIGSFLNVVIYRLPRGIFFVNARSFCPACKKQLRFLDLVPVLSFIIQRGRCRYCKMPISWQYPIIEAVCAFFAILCFMRFGFTIACLLSFLVIVTLLAISVIDFKTMEIPDSLVVALLFFAVCGIWVFGDVSIFDRIIGALCISVPMLILALIIEGAFGGGDIKLIAACGFLLGWQCTLLAFFISLLFGGGYAIWLLTTKKGEVGQHIAFGPYLCVGIGIGLMFGNEIIAIYLSFLMGW